MNKTSLLLARKRVSFLSSSVDRIRNDLFWLPLAHRRPGPRHDHCRRDFATLLGTTSKPTFIVSSLWMTPTNQTRKSTAAAADVTVAADDDASQTVSTTTSPPDCPDHNDTYILARRQGMRCLAIVAHVDHGKTTLVDKLLSQASQQQQQISTTNNNITNNNNDVDRLLDSSDLEKERGITITSKVTRLIYNHDNNNNNNKSAFGNKEEEKGSIIINIADTPVHADFSAEVDRFLSVADGFLLLVDAAEGPKSQTKYVLTRALALGLHPIVVLNKCDRADALTKIDSGETEAQIHELFVTLGASKEQLSSYTTLYASAREGWVTDDPLQALELSEETTNHDATKNLLAQHSMRFLLDCIVHEIPAPSVRRYNVVRSPKQDYPENDDDSTLRLTAAKDFEGDVFSMAAVSVGVDPYLGRTCSGRITSGSIAVNDRVLVIPREQTDPAKGSSQHQNPQQAQANSSTSNISGMFVYEGISRIPLEGGRAYAGDIVTLTGVPDHIAVGDTLTGSANPIPHPLVTPPLAPPTLAMDWSANDGPLAGQEGTILAASKVRDRLIAETDNNVTLKVELSATDSDKTSVYARGELQLGILVEQMRREGFEMVISPPRILTKTCPETGKVLEPYEEVMIDVDSEYAGAVVNILTGDRKGTLMSMSESSKDGKSQLVFEMPSRGMLGGFNSELATATRGSAVVNHIYIGDREQVNLTTDQDKGRLVSNDKGKASAYALAALEARGTLFVAPGDHVYSGMVIGENSKPGDLEVNPVRAKQTSNMRTQAKDEKTNLAPPKRMTVEELIGYMTPDEMIEITPKSVRLRKKLLHPGARERAARQKAKQRRSLKENK